MLAQFYTIQIYYMIPFQLDCLSNLRVVTSVIIFIIAFTTEKRSTLIWALCLIQFIQQKITLPDIVISNTSYYYVKYSNIKSKTSEALVCNSHVLPAPVSVILF